MLSATEPSSESGCSATVRRKIAESERCGTSTDTDTDVARGADVLAGKRASRHTLGRRKHGPGKDTAGSHSDIKADGVNGSLIALRDIRSELLKLHSID